MGELDRRVYPARPIAPSGSRIDHGLHCRTPSAERHHQQSPAPLVEIQYSNLDVAALCTMTLPTTAGITRRLLCLEIRRHNRDRDGLRLSPPPSHHQGRQSRMTSCCCRRRRERESWPMALTIYNRERESRRQVRWRERESVR